jgi:diguanylate cyclase (GGDEF)-like protein
MSRWPSSPLRPGDHGLAVVAIGVVVVHAVVNLTASAELGRTSPVPDVLCNLTFGLAAACSFRRAATSSTPRPWKLQGAAISAYLAADVVAQHLSSGGLPIPSVADVLWLSSYLLMYAAIVAHARALASHRPPRAWVDGIVAGLGIGALVTAVALEPLLRLGSGRTAEVLTNLAYPVADLVLVVLLVSTLQVVGHRSPSSWLRAAGLGTFLVADTAYLLGIANGSWTNGTPLELVWVLGVTLLGLSALADQDPEPLPPVAPRLVVPFSSTVGVIALLVAGQWVELGPVTIALASVTLALAAMRVVGAVEEIRALAASERAARLDVHTGLPNRRALTERVDAALARPDASGALVVIELRARREVGDSLGFRAADLLVTRTAERLLAGTERSATLARVGADEFALWIPGASAGAATAAAEQVHRLLDEPTTVAGIPIDLDAVVGVACAPDDATTSSALLACADIAARRAGRERRRVATYRQDPTNPSRARLALRSEVRRALEAGEIVAHFQPQVALASDEVVGLEALARWEHPERGLLPPGAFLQVVVESGLLPQLTSQMVTSAAGVLSTCAERGHRVGVSVNVTAIDLADDALLGGIEAALAGLGDRAGHHVGDLTLEITEDAVLWDRRRASDILSLVRSLGARVSVDDYGTGHASLSYIRDLPLDELKLDRSFVQGAPTDPRTATMVRSTIDLSHDLGLSTVAEGIEDDLTLAWLAFAGCDIGQGFHLARPMPVDALLDWMAARRAPQAVAGG